MTTPVLPIIDPARTEFGFCRTVCACHNCTRYCHHVPGYLIPADVDRIHRHLSADMDLSTWSRQHLLASPGALVLCQGKVLRIRTLVPARRPDGACTFLTDTDQCAIHPVAPFGCAFFDSHLADEEADRRSKRGLRAAWEAWDTIGPYALLWMTLAGTGLMAPAPEIARKQLQGA